MSNIFSGLVVNWRLAFLVLLVVDVSIESDTKYNQTKTVACKGTKAIFQWKYKVKQFLGVLWTLNETEIALSTDLNLSPERISDRRLKKRLHFISQNPFVFAIRNSTKADLGTYGCTFTLLSGHTESVTGDLIVKDYTNGDIIKEVEKKGDCVSLNPKASNCTWVFSNGTESTTHQLKYCSRQPEDKIKCICDTICQISIYTKTFKEDTNVSNVGIIVGTIVGAIVGVIIVVAIVIIYQYKKNKGIGRFKVPKDGKTSTDTPPEVGPPEVGPLLLEREQREGGKKPTAHPIQKEYEREEGASKGPLPTEVVLSKGRIVAQESRPKDEDGKPIRAVTLEELEYIT